MTGTGKRRAGAPLAAALAGIRDAARKSLTQPGQVASAGVASGSKRGAVGSRLDRSSADVECEGSGRSLVRIYSPCEVGIREAEPDTT